MRRVEEGREPQRGLLGEGDVDAESPDCDESPGPLLPRDRANNPPPSALSSLELGLIFSH